MAFFDGFNNDEVSALTLYQLNGHLRQIQEIHKMLHGDGENAASNMTEEEMRAESKRYDDAMRGL